MTVMVTPTQISLDIGQRLGELDRLMAQYKAAEKDDADKTTAFKVAYAKAFLAVEEGPVVEKQHKATLATEKELGEAEVAAALVRVLKADMHRVETHIDALRTSAATVRAEFKTLDYGPGA